MTAFIYAKNFQTVQILWCDRRYKLAASKILGQDVNMRLLLGSNKNTSYNEEYRLNVLLILLLIRILTVYIKYIILDKRQNFCIILWIQLHP